MAKLSDNEPATWTKDQNSTVVKPLQRFAHRRAADAEIAGNVFFTHPLAADDAAIRDRVPQTFVDEIRAGPRTRLRGVKNVEGNSFQALGHPNQTFTLDRVSHYSSTLCPIEAATGEWLTTPGQPLYTMRHFTVYRTMFIQRPGRTTYENTAFRNNR